MMKAVLFLLTILAMPAASGVTRRQMIARGRAGSTGSEMLL